MSKFYKMYLASSKVYFLNHCKSLSQAADYYEMQVQINGITLEAELSHKGGQCKLFPQFLEIQFGQPCYSPKLSDQSVCFIGWRPYQLVIVQAFKDKLAFKRLLTGSGITVPTFSQDPECDWANVIVKSRIGSFGTGMKGPFKNALSYHLNIDKGEYFEQFIQGQVLKILYFNEQPIFLECHDMPILTGNGQSSIRQLAKKRAKARDRCLDEIKFNEILTYQERKLDEVLAPGKWILADFRYESDLLPCYAVKEIELKSEADCSYYNELKLIGNFLYSHIRQEISHAFFYSVDAILTPDQQLWVLEANSNPTIHQSGYRYLLATIGESFR